MLRYMPPARGEAIKAPNVKPTVGERGKKRGVEGRGEGGTQTCGDSVAALLRNGISHFQAGCAHTHILQVATGLLPQPLQLVHGVIQAGNERLQASLGAHCGHLHDRASLLKALSPDLRWALHVSTVSLDVTCWFSVINISHGKVICTVGCTAGVGGGLLGKLNFLSK